MHIAKVCNGGDKDFEKNKRHKINEANFFETSLQFEATIFLP